MRHGLSFMQCRQTGTFDDEVPEACVVFGDAHSFAVQGIKDNLKLDVHLFPDLIPALVTGLFVKPLLWQISLEVGYPHITRAIYGTRTCRQFPCNHVTHEAYG